MRKLKVKVQFHTVSQSWWWSLWRRYGEPAQNAWAIVASQDGFKTADDAVIDWVEIAHGVFAGIKVRVKEKP